MFIEKISEKRGFARNFVALTSSSFLLHFVNLFTNMYLARALGPENFGKYGVLITWSGILLSVAALGIDQVSTRSVARNQDNSLFYLRLSMMIRLVGLSLVSILFIVYSLYTKELSFVIVLLILINTLFTSIWNNIQCVAFGMRRMESTGYINVAGSTILLGVYFFMPSSLVNVTIIFLLLVIVQIFKDIVYYYKSVREGLFTGDDTLINKMIIKDTIIESLPFYVLVLFSLITNQFPVLFLSENSGNMEVAYFNTANKLLIPLSVILGTMFQALFPVLVEEKDKQPKKFYKNTKRVLFIVISMGVLSCYCVSLFRDDIVLLIYGEEYKSTGLVMLTQCWYVVYFSILSLYGTLYIVLGRDKLLATLSIINAIVWAPLLWFSSKNGAVSISYGFVIGAIVNLVTNSIALYLADKKMLSILNLSCLNVLMFLGFVFSLMIPNDIHLLYRILALAVVGVIGFSLYHKFLRISI